MVIFIKEYLNQILKEKEEMRVRERERLFEAGNLPVLNKANESLPELQESIVKIIYVSSGIFWSDLKKMFAFSADEGKLKRAVKALLTQEYLLEEETCFGKIYGLTKEGISQVRGATKEEKVNINPMNLNTESSLSKKKLVSAKIADYVFDRQAVWLWNDFFSTEVKKRNEYIVDVYLTQILYRYIKEQAKEEQEARFLEAGIEEKMAKEMAETEKYIGSQAKNFADCYLKTHERDKLKKRDEYHIYLELIKKQSLSEYPSINTFYLLKEYPLQGRRKPYAELSLVLNFKCNMTKIGMEKVRNYQKEEMAKNVLLQKERELEQISYYIKIFNTSRRNLINTNAYKKKEDKLLLEEVTNKIAALDRMLEKLHQRREELETDFSFRILKSYDEDGENYEDRILNFGRLLQNGIFFQDCFSKEKKEIRFFITQQQDDFFDLFSLHKKTAMAYLFARRLYPFYKISIEVLVHNEEQKSFIESKRASLKKKLLSVRETAVLGNLLDEILTVNDLKSDVEERYLYFHRLLEDWKKRKGEIGLC